MDSLEAFLVVSAIMMTSFVPDFRLHVHIARSASSCTLRSEKRLSKARLWINDVATSLVDA